MIDKVETVIEVSNALAPETIQVFEFIYHNLNIWIWMVIVMYCLTDLFTGIRNHHMYKLIYLQVMGKPYIHKIWWKKVIDKIKERKNNV